MKNKYIKWSVITLIAFTLLSFVNAGDWKSFESKLFKFRVEFPDVPTEQSQTVPSAIGDLKMNFYMYDASSVPNSKDENLVYMVNYTSYPKDKVNSNNKEMLKTFFDGAVSGAVANVQGKLISQKDINYGLHPGREAKIDFQNGTAIINVRLYLVANNMYMIQTITETKKDNNASIKKFMDSFKITE